MFQFDLNGDMLYVHSHFQDQGTFQVQESPLPKWLRFRHSVLIKSLSLRKTIKPWGTNIRVKNTFVKPGFRNKIQYIDLSRARRLLKKTSVFDLSLRTF